MNIEGILVLSLFCIALLGAAGAATSLVVIFILFQVLDPQKVPMRMLIWGGFAIGCAFGIMLNTLMFIHRKELEQAIQKERDKPIILYNEDESQPSKGGNTHVYQEPEQP